MKCKIKRVEYEKLAFSWKFPQWHIASYEQGFTIELSSLSQSTLECRENIQQVFKGVQSSQVLL